MLRNVDYGRLWVHISADVRDEFLRNLDVNIALGDELWTGWWGDLHAGPINTDCFGVITDPDSSTDYNCPVAIAGITAGGEEAGGDIIEGPEIVTPAQPPDEILGGPDGPMDGLPINAPNGNYDSPPEEPDFAPVDETLPDIDY